MAEEEFPTYRLLQPELMTGDELGSILRKYNVKLDFGTVGIGELVEIYRRVALPLPQRTYGSSWRERLLAKKQNRRKISITEESKESGFSVKRETSASSSRSTPSRANHDRLKPPLDSSLGKEKKIIRLSCSKVDESEVRTSSSSSSKVDDSEVRTSSSSSSKVDDSEVQTSSSESSETKKDSNGKTEPATKRKRITIDFSDTSEKSTPLPKVVSSKRPSDEKSPRQPVSKHRRIVI